MGFSLSEERQVFRKTVRDMLQRSCDVEALRAAWASPDGRVPGLWARLADLGVPALAVPEEYGGVGGDEVDLVLVAEEVGRAAAPEPVVETLAGAVVLARAGGPRAAEWLPRVAEGRGVLALGVAPGRLVSAAAWADLLLVERDGALTAARRDEATLIPQPTVDRGVRLASVETSGAVLAGATPGDALDRAALLASAQLVGLAAAMLDAGVGYAQQREQFGRTIGSFQAVKHLLADVLVAVEFARPLVYRAAVSLRDAAPTAARDVSAAKHAATSAAQQAARTALQVHGAIGYTFEHDLHMWLKRTWTLSSSWGTAGWHRQRVARALSLYG